MTLYRTRDLASRHAKRNGLTNFWIDLSHTTRDAYRIIEMPGVSPAAEWAKGKDFVHHVESRYIDEGKSPGMQGVIVVTCTLKELADENVPDEFLIVPLTPSLFDAESVNVSRRAKGDRSADAPKGERAKSDAESPVKIVWATADAMPGATRQEVVAACVAKGVNSSTASTQFYRWQKAKNG